MLAIKTIKYLEEASYFYVLSELTRDLPLFNLFNPLYTSGLIH